MINNVVLVGRLTKDVDLRYTQNGIAVGTFTLAVNRSYTDQQGNRQADFINCVIWRKPAETVANYTVKGSQLAIVGSLQTRTYDNAQGQKVYVTEVLVSEWEFLDTKQELERKQVVNQQKNDLPDVPAERMDNNPIYREDSYNGNLGGINDVAGNYWDRMGE